MVVFPIVLTYGKSKLQNLDFLLDAINKMKALIAEGLQIEDQKLNFVLKGVICDAPAKAIVRCTKQYSGYCGCDKCNQKGIWLQKIAY